VNTLDILRRKFAMLYKITIEDVSPEDSVFDLRRRFCWLEGFDNYRVDLFEMLLAMQDELELEIPEHVAETLDDQELTLRELADRIDRYRRDTE
jgi:hypothetical protein